MPKAAKNYIRNQYNYNCCQYRRNTQTSQNSWFYNKQSNYWLYFEHIRYKIQKAENQFQNTGSFEYWNKVKKLQYIQYELVENAINLQEEDIEELIPLYTTKVKEEHIYLTEIKKENPQEPITISEESDSDCDNKSESTENSYIPNNQEELLDEELTDEEELLYKTYLKSQPQTPTSEY